MTTRAIRRLVAAMVIMSVPFVLGSCGEDKEKQAEIERLNEKIEGFNERLKGQPGRFQPTRQGERRTP